MTHDPIRHYVVLNANPEVRREYFCEGSDGDRWATQYVAKHVYGRELDKPPFQTVARPSNDVHSAFEKEAPEPQQVVVALEVSGDGKVHNTGVVDDIIKAVSEKRDIFAGSSADIPFAGADHWCGDRGDPIFSDRSEAEQLLGVDYLRKQSGTSGMGVNVVVVDQGLDKSVLGASYGTGWSVGSSLPGSAPPHPGSLGRSHGMMIAHNILKVAPDAKLFDLPLAPPRIGDIQNFLSSADAAYRKMLDDIKSWRTGAFPGPWILVNPWGIFDRASEYPKGHYTQDPNNLFNQLVVEAVNQNIDVLFSAGNCGQFCPDNRCGASDQGPGRSIWGANSLEAVLTVGAVRADTIWLGYSSQGPGQPRLGPRKPDICATSQFCEDDDAFSVNTGTSAACGLTAGIIAALRSRWDSTRVPPLLLNDIINQVARKPPHLHWGNALSYRLGNGILDARATFDELESQFP